MSSRYSANGLIIVSLSADHYVVIDAIDGCELRYGLPGGVHPNLSIGTYVVIDHQTAMGHGAVFSKPIFQRKADKTSIDIVRRWERQKSPMTTLTNPIGGTVRTPEEQTEREIKKALREFPSRRGLAEEVVRLRSDNERLSKYDWLPGTAQGDHVPSGRHGRPGDWPV